MSKEELKKKILELQIAILKLQILLFNKKLTVPDVKNGPTKIIIHHGGGWMDFAGVNAYHKQKWGFKSALSEKGIEEI